MSSLALPTQDTTQTLRRVLMADAASGLGMGVVQLAFTSTVAGLTGLAPALLTWSGLALFPCAALMLWTAFRRPLALPAVWIIVAGNAAWVLASLVLLAESALPALGVAYVLAQAAVVAALATLEGYFACSARYSS